jgi:hypothetical protein
MEIGDHGEIEIGGLQFIFNLLVHRIEHLFADHLFFSFQCFEAALRIRNPPVYYPVSYPERPDAASVCQ